MVPLLCISKLWFVSTGLFRTVLNSKTCSHYPQPSSLNTQQAPLQHGNEFNLILQLPTISYFLGSHTVLLKPPVFWRIPTVSFISSVALPLLVLLSAAQPPIFSSLHCLCFRVSHGSLTLAVFATCAGILQCESSQVRDKTQIFRLFCHECQRVFHDRLINNQDKDYFNGIICGMAGESKAPSSCFLASPISQLS